MVDILRPEKVEYGQVWLHKRTQTKYLVCGKAKLKCPVSSEWVDAVRYIPRDPVLDRGDNVRALADFVESFTFIGWEK